MNSMNSPYYKADETAAENAAGACDCFHRPAWHITARSGWINDPNGLINHDGWYHVFFQHNPFSPAPGRIYWGHARSRDLVNWENLPIALVPENDYDRDGCWSGSAVVKDGRLILVYSGNREGRHPGQVQCLAESGDGVIFHKSGTNPVLSESPEQGSDDFRDPKVWQHENRWYMVLGTSFQGRGRVLLYQSPDLFRWTFQSVVLESDGTEGHMWECPDLFRLDGVDVLIVSPIGMPGHRNIWFTGHFDYQTGVFTRLNRGDLDYGLDFYAVQTFTAPDKSRLILAWMNYWNTPMPTAAQGYAGALTMPRRLVLIDGTRVGMVPALELQSLRQGNAIKAAFDLEAGMTYLWKEADGQILELDVLIEPALKANGMAGVEICSAPDRTERTRVFWEVKNGQIGIDASLSGMGGPKTIEKGPVQPQSPGRMNLRIFTDRSSVEVFADNGRATVTARIYPASENRLIRFFNITGTDCRFTVSAWKLKQDVILDLP